MDPILRNINRFFVLSIKNADNDRNSTAKKQQFRLYD